MLEDNQKINVIAWEAKKRNFSYGVFSAMLTEENKKQVYKQFEEYLTPLQSAWILPKTVSGQGLLVSGA